MYVCMYVSWLVPRDFRYHGSIKDAMSLKQRKQKQKQKEKQRDSFERTSVSSRPTSDVTPTAQDLKYNSDCTT